jgi:hypothetical protein
VLSVILSIHQSWFLILKRLVPFFKTKKKVTLEMRLHNKNAPTRDDLCKMSVIVDTHEQKN